MSKIYVCSWGYEQTNVNFYQVVRESEKSLWLREIGSHVLRYDSSMSGSVLPNEDDFIGDIFRVLQPKHTCINVKFGLAYLWNGEPVSFSEWN